MLEAVLTPHPAGEQTPLLPRASPLARPNQALKRQCWKPPQRSGGEQLAWAGDEGRRGSEAAQRRVPGGPAVRLFHGFFWAAGNNSPGRIPDTHVVSRPSLGNRVRTGPRRGWYLHRQPVRRGAVWLFCFQAHDFVDTSVPAWVQWRGPRGPHRAYGEKQVSLPSLGKPSYAS